MLVALPLVTFLGVWASLAARSPEAGLARSFLRAAMVTATWTALTTELLSLIHGITRAGLAIAWGLPAVLAIGWFLAKHRAIPSDTLRSDLARTRDEFAPAAAIAGILIVTAVVAWAAPPQTWDSLNYHMSRVAHWAQNRSVEPFATGIEQQNSRSPGAEFGVLHLYVLAGSDRWVNFVSWGAFSGLIVAAYVLARQAGIGRDGRWLAAVYTATLPMGLVQASSTMTDAVAALWVAAAAVEVVALDRDQPPWGSAIWGSLATGLAVLAKPTALPFLVPLAVWAGFRLFRASGWRTTVAMALLAVGLVGILNAGHWTRSFILYGDPISGGNQIEVHANQVLGLDGQISNVLRNAALQLGTPSPHVNRVLAAGIVGIHRLIGLSPNDPRTTAHGYFKVEVPMLRENSAANPVQAYLGLFALGAMVVRRNVPKALVGLAASAVAGFWLFSAMFKWQIFGSRYHLAFFVLMAPVAGAVLAGLARGRAATWAAGAMVLLSLPWLLSIRSRPVVPIPDDSLLGSVLVTPRTDLMFANAQYLAEPYGEMADRIRESGCGRVGIALGGNSAEYPLWSLLGLPRADRNIEWMVEGSPSASWSRPGYTPCAVVCEGCADDERFRGLPRVYSFSRYVLFLGRPDA